MKYKDITEQIKYDFLNIIYNKGNKWQMNQIYILEELLNSKLEEYTQMGLFNPYVRVKLEQTECGFNEVNMLWYYKSERLYDYDIDNICSFDEDVYLFEKEHIKEINSSIIEDTLKPIDEFKYYRQRIIDYLKETGLNDKQADYVKNKIYNEFRRETKHDLHITDLKIWVKHERIYGLKAYKEIPVGNKIICFTYGVTD